MKHGLLSRIVIGDPNKYRDEAEHLRRKAEKSIDPGLQQTMLDIAGLYERMADGIAKWNRLEKR